MTGEEGFPLPDGEVHLWLTKLADASDPSLTEKYQALLAPAERAQQARFHFARDRHRYLVTRALVRTVLTRYGGLPASDWIFTRTPHGRPIVASACRIAGDIVFNLSHSTDLIVCAVRRRGALGVDTENLQREVWLATADRYFSGPELRDLQALPAGLHKSRFLELWTLKESYIKARGLGLSIPLDQFGFRFPVLDGIEAYFDNDDEPGAWKFWQFRYGDDNLVALCAQNDRPLHLRSHEGAPFRAWVPVELKTLMRCSD